jgi:type I restriction enzyme S subunit
LAVPEFYYYLFEMLGSELWRLATGTTFGEVSARDFGNIIVPSPRLEEQRRIAEVLDEVDGLISASMARSRKLEALKWGLVESFLREDAECGVQTTLDSILVGIDAGWSPLCEERTPVSEEWGVLKVSSVTTGRFIESESKALLPGFRPRPELRVCENDLLMCRANGVASLVGKVALVKYAPERLMLSDKTLRLVIDSGKASQDYLYFLLSSRSVRLQIDTMLSGSSGQKNIPQRFIRSINIPLPGLARQAEVVAAVSAVEADLEHERKLCTVLRDTRLGLAADLLSGRVRV